QRRRARAVSTPRLPSAAGRAGGAADRSRMTARARATVFVLFLLSTVAPAASTPAGASPVQTQSDILQLVSQTTFVEPDGDVSLRLRVTGSPSGARVRVQVHSRVPTRSDFKASISGKALRSGVGTPVIVPVVPDASGTVLV